MLHDTRPGFGALLEEPGTDAGPRTAAGSRPPGCDLRGLRSNGRCRLRPRTRRIAGCERCALGLDPCASTGLSLIRCFRAPEPPAAWSRWAWTHEPASRSNRRTTWVGEGFRHRTGLTRRQCCSPDVRRPPFLDWPSDVQQLIAEDDLITSTSLPAAPTRLSDGRTAHTWFLCGRDLPQRRLQDRRALATERSPRSRATSQTCGSRTRRR